MTLQQLKYIAEVDRLKSFALAAEALGITQPTLSGMIAKLEDELDIRIFERNSRKVATTAIGSQIAAQARIVIMEAGRIAEMAAEAKAAVSGELRLAVGPAIAPYILPDFIRIYLSDYREVALSLEELRPDAMLRALAEGAVDAGICTAGLAAKGIFEIPLYSEDFFLYLSDECMSRMPEFDPAALGHEKMWVMKEVQCLRESAFSFCKGRKGRRHVYEAGSIDTLIRIVDLNGGFTIIPRMHLPLLSPQQRQNVRPVDGEHISQRKISMYIRHDYVRAGLLNSVVDTIKKFMPAGMLEKSLIKNGIKL